ncbi:MAG: serine/threonine-protein kinase [Gemmataceae bacterium]
MSDAHPPRIPPSDTAVSGSGPEPPSSVQDWFNLSAVAEVAPRPFDDGDVIESPPLVAGYAILDRLGRGRVGQVYKAQSANSDRAVALKVIRTPGGPAPEGLVRLRQSLSAAARLGHPDIVQIFEVGERPGLLYIAQEFLPGGTLAAAVGRMPQAPEFAADLIETAARAVQAAHDAGVIHAGLSPQNILLDGVGRPRLTDFGLTTPEVADRSPISSCYRAPEQVGSTSGPVGRAADVYALGVILYELLTGRPPFLGAAAHKTVEYIRHHEPVAPQLLVPDLPIDLGDICLTCLRKNPAERYPGAKDLADDVRRFRRGEPIQSRQTSWTAKLSRKLLGH